MIIESSTKTLAGSGFLEVCSEIRSNIRRNIRRISRKRKCFLFHISFLLYISFLFHASYFRITAQNVCRTADFQTVEKLHESSNFVIV